MHKHQLLASTAVAALVLAGSAVSAGAQTAPTPVPPAATAPPAVTPPAVTPPAVTPPAVTPPAVQPAAPSATTTAPATPPATATPPAATTPAPSGPATTTTPPAAAPNTQGAQGTQPQQQLPEVQVIQEQPKPEPVPEPVQEAAPKPKKKPVAATPPPPPKPVAKAKPKPQPKPVQQAEPAPQPAPEPVAAPVEAASAPAWAGSPTVRVSPLAGSEIAIDKVPAGVSVVTSQDIQRGGPSSIAQAIDAKVPGATLNDTLGNPLANDLQFRGFSASPLNGTPQGLSIYQNGVRLNEVFGDATNFDLIPQIAIADIIVMSNNPVYGLNALGGAANVIMKDGFSFQGGTIDTKFGSFGHKTVAAEAGARSGNFGAYVAGEYIDEDGWRDRSPAEAKRLYGDLGAKGDGVELHLNYTFADTGLGVVGPTPVELLEDDRSQVFTSPQGFDNTMHMVNLQGSVMATETLTLSGNTYYRKFKQKRPDGNVSEALACDDPADPTKTGMVCFEEADDLLFVRAPDGSVRNLAIADLPDGGDTMLGGNDSVSVLSSSYGGAFQGVLKERLFDRPNQFLAGFSIDRGRAHVKSASEVGILDPETLVVQGLGLIIDQSAAPDGTFQPGDIEVMPLDLKVNTQYYGFYFSNTLDVTDQLALTVGGRYNIAKIQMRDQIDPDSDLNTNHKFTRFNPMVGATYKVYDGLSVYSGYSESNRAPTPAELGCSDPDRPCLLENFLVSDPPLKQVVGRTIEAGLRGEFTAGYSGYDALGGMKRNTVGWSLGYFRTELQDDILTAASPVQGRGYFLNAGDTLRQGVEAAVNYRSDWLFMYGSYAFVDATFRDPIELASPDAPVGIGCSDFVPQDPQDEQPNCANVQPGDHLPNVPRHRFKLGFDVNVTPAWKIGMDMTAVTGQYFRGDEGNEDNKLPGYAVFNLNTSYKVTDNVMVYGLVKNLFDTKFETFGTYYDPEALRNLNGDEVGVGPNGKVLENPRTVTPAAPFAIYGGVKVKF